jgi:hypothetical protein
MELWEAELNTTQEFNQLFMGATNTRAVRARSPNLGQTFVWESSPCTRTHCCSSKAAACADSIKAAKAELTFSAADAQYMPSSTERSAGVNFIVFHGWTESRHYLKEVGAMQLQTC